MYRLRLGKAAVTTTKTFHAPFGRLPGWPPDHAPLIYLVDSFGLVFAQRADVAQG
jgi:hypothetical protein